MGEPEAKHGLPTLKCQVRLTTDNTGTNGQTNGLMWATRTKMGEPIRESMALPGYENKLEERMGEPESEGGFQDQDERRRGRRTVQGRAVKNEI